MSRRRPAYASGHEQPGISSHNPRRNDRRNNFEEQQQQHPAYQDSWRSYRNDATNLQQLAGYAGLSGMGYSTPVQQLQGRTGSSDDGLNPAASSFQPINTGPLPLQSRSNFTPYQPLRTSNGQKEKRAAHQTRFNSSLANRQAPQQYALRSHGSVNVATDIQDVPVPSIEDQTLPTCSIPTSLGPLRGHEALRRLTPKDSSPSASPPPAPSPTRDYLAQSMLLPEKLEAPQKLLIVVDLNGTLLKRAASRGTTFVLRPGVTNLMEYLFANHVVMIYTSSRPENAQGMVNKLLHPKQRSQLAAVWARDKLGLNKAQYHSKVQVYKKLDKIWADKQIQKRASPGNKWSQRNTVLIDDSHLKALAQPYNLLRVEEFQNDRPYHDGKAQSQEQLDALNAWSATQQQILKDLEMKLEELKWTADVSRLVRTWQTADAVEKPQVNDQSPEPEPTQLMTPKSPEPRRSESDESDGGVDSRQNDIDELVAKVDSHHVHANASDQDAASDGSVSPIDEAIWKDILGGIEQGKTASQSSKPADT